MRRLLGSSGRVQPPKRQRRVLGFALDYHRSMARIGIDLGGTRVDASSRTFADIQDFEITG